MFPRGTRLLFPLLVSFGCGTGDLPLGTTSSSVEAAPPVETYVWQEFLPAVSPPPRRFTAAAYDEVRRNVVLFGGQLSSDYAHVIANGTWLWDGATWAEADVPDALRPPPRWHHAMAFDAARQQVVLFGGYNHQNGQLGDTWVWDGTAWKDVSPESSSPGARMLHAMTYDPIRQRVVLYGGMDDVGERHADVWEWDGAGWTDVTPEEGGPGERAGRLMAYDEARERVLLVSGSSAWEWDGSSWVDVSPADLGGPVPRSGGVLVYDTHRRRAVLAGGDQGRYTDYPSTWEWDGAMWTEVTGPAEPFGRISAAAAYDTHNGRVVLFGGGYQYRHLDVMWGETLTFHSYGGACTRDDQCNDGHCVDGVCCTTACDDGCSVCSVAKGATVDGICAPNPDASNCEPDVDAGDGDDAGEPGDEPPSGSQPEAVDNGGGCQTPPGAAGSVGGAIVGLGALAGAIRRRR